MSHYFINDEKLNHEIQEIILSIGKHVIHLDTDRGVFSRNQLDIGTQILLENIDFSLSYQTIIDMGCGYGPIGIYAAKMCPNANVIMADVNERAVFLASSNIEKNHVKNALTKVSFLFDQVKEKADLIITNPPIRAGKQIVFSLYEQAYENLNQGGLFYIVIQKKQGAPSSVKKLEETFKNCTIVTKVKGYWVLLAKK
ncbi:MAG: methyltransferase [Acholeplasmataceae bacterium]